jgi:hypothetical protein
LGVSNIALSQKTRQPSAHIHGIEEPFALFKPWIFFDGAAENEKSMIIIKGSNAV